MALIICPGCGHSAEVEKAQRKRYVCSLCGAKDVRIIRRTKWWMPPREQRPAEQARRNTYWALRLFARQKGFRDGWAAYRFRTLYGQWPTDADQVPLEEEPTPCEDLVAWITAQNAKRSAQRRKEKQHAQALKA
jgi:hypothetical protein